MRRLETCPKCGSQYSIEEARAACSDCVESTRIGGCGYVRCPRCGHEYSDKKYPDWILERKKYRQII